MRAIVKANVSGAFFALAATAAPGASAQSFVEQAIEYRFQLYFRVNDAALQKMLPAEWEQVTATMGPAMNATFA